MTVKEIIKSDYRVDKDKIQNELRKIKPLSKCKDEEIPMPLLEKLFKIICDKYRMYVKLRADTWSSDEGIIWTATVIDIDTLKDLEVCCGLGLYETIAKTSIVLYYLSRKRKNGNN